jgi:hypothetical protein
MIRHRCGPLNRTIVACALALFARAATAQTFVPPAGFSGKPGPAIASNPEKDAPLILSVEANRLAGRVHVVPEYSRADHAHVAVVGAYTVQEPKGTHLIESWGVGFLPVILSFSDGRCFAFTAEYIGGHLSNARVARIGCDSRRVKEQLGPDAPASLSLKRIGTSWGYGAWFDAKSGSTLITVPFSKTFEPFLTARMKVTAIQAMNGPDWPGGNVTLVGRIHGRLTIVTLDVSY